METWKNIEGYEGKYQVSDYGRVRSFRTGKAKIMAQYAGSWGYLIVNINKKPQLVHRLIAQAFIPNPESKMMVNHKNADKRDNLPQNLEWVTNKENLNHAWTSGLNDKQKKKVAQYDLEGNFIAEYESINSATRALNAPGQHSNLRKVCNGKRKYFHGYVWKFV